MADNSREDEEERTRRRASLLNIRYFDSTTIKHYPMFEDMLSIQQMYKYRAVVLSKQDHQVIVAITSKTPNPALDEIQKLFPDERISFVMITESGFKEYMLKYDPPEEVNYNDIRISQDEDTDNIAEVSKTIMEVKADDILPYLAQQASRINASDIHLETEENDVRIRFRVDGVLHEIAKFDYDKYRQLASAIAIAGNIATSSPRAQTGHIDIKLPDTGEALNMRIETVPTLYGQDAVIRMFHMDEQLLNVANLGLRQQHRDNIQEVIDKPSGLVMAVGPTGSGKTTTLYSILNSLKSSTRKLITLEDPVEYSIPGVVQIPVETDKDETFADKLRTVLRLDPDVVMVGEIRDVDTARTALQAALSGHLVLSTFHANDAATALDRMLDMVGDNPLFTNAIRLVIAQRLVRKLDTDVAKEYTPDEAITSKFNAIIDNFPQGLDKQNPDSAKFYQPGQSEDSPFGFNGQTAVMETLKLTPEITKILRRPSREINIDDIKESAHKDGMVSMLEDGALKVLEGETTVEELFRVVA